MTGEDRRIGVVLITHNRKDEALDCIRRLLDLPERPRVVVVDNGSTDGTAQAISARFGPSPRLDLVASPENLGAVGRNVGVERLDTPYVAFCDDDVWWEPGALTRCADLLDAHPGLAVITGHIVVEPSGEDDPIDAELRDSPVQGPDWLPGSALGSFLAGASALRREAFVDCGGFSERLWLGGEEELLAADLATAGWELCHVPDVVVHHHGSPNRDVRRRRRDGLRNTLWFTWLRRPLGPALSRTWWLLRNAPHDAVTAAALWHAVRGLPWVLHERRPMPPRVEARFAALDAPQRASTARSYR